MASNHFRQPVNHTCPDIDRIIKDIRSAIKTSEQGMKLTDKDSEAYDHFWKICLELDEMEDTLEKLRVSNAALRDWGIEEAIHVDELEMKLELEKETTH